MRAVVKAVHKDKSVTVEPYFYQDQDGNDVGSFQGGVTVRLRERDCGRV